uniref:Ground-like domain-containing protein n=1 Tax=Steinernema glaseri TaxID=37863 RepID=A0A1I8ADK3_9BILA
MVGASRSPSGFETRLPIAPATPFLVLFWSISGNRRRRSEMGLFILICLVGLSRATFLTMNSGPICCCGCESNCPPQAPTCPPPQNPCPQTSYWFGQQYQRCSSFNGGVAWRQPYSEFVSLGSQQPSYNSFSPGFAPSASSVASSPSSSFQQDGGGDSTSGGDGAGNYLYPGGASSSAPTYPDYNAAPAPAAPPASSDYLPSPASHYGAPPAASVDPPPAAPPSPALEVQPALIHESEALVENDHYDQFDNPTDRAPQVIPIQKTIRVVPPSPTTQNFTDYDADYIQIDGLPKHKIDQDSNHFETDPDEEARYVDSDILTTTTLPAKSTSTTVKSKFVSPKNKSVDPEMVRIGRVLSDIEAMLEMMVKKEMEIDVYDDEPPALQKDEDAAKRFFSGEYEGDFVNILDEEDKEPTVEVSPTRSTATTTKAIETTTKAPEVHPARNLTMQEIIENLRMQHLRAERRRKFIETLEARVSAERRTPRLRRDILAESTNRANGTVGTVDGHCNSVQLKELISREISGVSEAATAKRKVQKAAEETLKGIFNVICSNSEFSFLVNSPLSCSASNEKVACFAFLEPGSV